MINEFLFNLDLPPSYESHVGSKEITNLASSTKFLSFALDTGMLKNVDLSLLQSEDERLCFMVNLYNLMLTHGILVLLGGSIDLLPQPEKTDLHNWSYESLMEKPVGRLALHQFLSYQVGEIGVLRFVSIFVVCIWIFAVNDILKLLEFHCASEFSFL